MLCLLDGQQTETSGAVNNQNRPREVATNHEIPSHSNDRKIAAATEICRMQVKITGMSCSSCVNKIESTLSSKKGKIYSYSYMHTYAIATT